MVHPNTSVHPPARTSVLPAEILGELETNTTRLGANRDNKGHTPHPTELARCPECAPRCACETRRNANRDRVVNFDDLLALSQHYGLTGQTFSQGNFDYSSDGRVGFDDLLIVAQRYGTSLPALTAVPMTKHRSTRAVERVLS